MHSTHFRQTFLLLHVLNNVLDLTKKKKKISFNAFLSLPIKYTFCGPVHKIVMLSIIYHRKRRILCSEKIHVPFIMTCFFSLIVLKCTNKMLSTYTVLKLNFLNILMHNPSPKVSSLKHI